MCCGCLGLGRWSQPIYQAPFNLGPQQLGGFFPIAASVFQIQSVFVPTHEPLLVRWPLRSKSPVYLRGKIAHSSAPICRKTGVRHFPSPGGTRSTHSTASEVYGRKYRNTTREIALILRWPPPKRDDKPSRLGGGHRKRDDKPS